MSDVKAKAAEMFAAGESVNAVAKALFKGNWGTANKLHTSWKAGDINAVVDRRKKRGGKRTEAEQPAAEADQAPEIWDVKLEVPDVALDGVIATFTRQEKAAAVANTLQARVDALAAG